MLPHAPSNSSRNPRQPPIRRAKGDAFDIHSPTFFVEANRYCPSRCAPIGCLRRQCTTWAARASQACAGGRFNRRPFAGSAPAQPLAGGLADGAHLSDSLGGSGAGLYARDERLVPPGVSFALDTGTWEGPAASVDNSQHAGILPICHHLDVNNVLASNSQRFYPRFYFGDDPFEPPSSPFPVGSSGLQSSSNGPPTNRQPTLQPMEIAMSGSGMSRTSLLRRPSASMSMT